MAVAYPDRIGRKLRLEGLSLEDLPEKGAKSEDLQVFIVGLLQEAIDFTSTVDSHYADAAANTGWYKKGKKSYKGASKIGGCGTIDVDLLTRTVPDDVLRGVIDNPPPPPPGDYENNNANTTNNVVLVNNGLVNGNLLGNGNARATANDASNIANNNNSANNNENASGVINAGGAALPNSNASLGDAAINGGGPQQPSRRRQRITPETWACRRSSHNNSPTGGTASWCEFNVYMKDLHVETELAMTDTVVEAQKVYEWAGARDLPICELWDVDRGGGPWTDFRLTLVEMQHDLKAWPLKSRVFPVLQLTSASVGAALYPEIYVISVPINNWRQYEAPKGIKKLGDQSNIVLGSYTSVERFRLKPGAVERGGPAAAVEEKVARRRSLPRTLRRNKSTGKSGNAGDAVEASVPTITESAARHGKQPRTSKSTEEVSNSPPENTHIEWTMATASHARGILPLFLQTPFVPAKIAEDVPLFTKWMAEVRRSKPPPANSAIDEGVAVPDPAVSSLGVPSGSGLPPSSVLFDDVSAGGKLNNHAADSSAAH